MGKQVINYVIITNNDAIDPKICCLNTTKILGLARRSGCNATRIEPFDFSLHYNNSAVCR